MPKHAQWTLRESREIDRGFLKKVFDSSWHRAFSLVRLSPEMEKQLLDHQFEAQDSSYRQSYSQASFSLVLIGDEPIGRFYVDRRAGEFGLLEMTLLPEFRNKGIGTSLIQALLEEAAACQKSVVLHVEHWNPEARRLYERLGFEVEADISTHWRMRWTPALTPPVS